MEFMIVFRPKDDLGFRFSGAWGSGLRCRGVRFRVESLGYLYVGVTICYQVIRSLTFERKLISEGPLLEASVEATGG